MIPNIGTMCVGSRIPSIAPTMIRYVVAVPMLLFDA